MRQTKSLKQALFNNINTLSANLAARGSSESSPARGGINISVVSAPAMDGKAARERLASGLIQQMPWKPEDVKPSIHRTGAEPIGYASTCLTLRRITRWPFSTPRQVPDSVPCPLLFSWNRTIILWMWRHPGQSQISLLFKKFLNVLQQSGWLAIPRSTMGDSAYRSGHSWETATLLSSYPTFSSFMIDTGNLIQPPPTHPTWLRRLIRRPSDYSTK